jgi:hypothetical protein
MSSATTKSKFEFQIDDFMTDAVAEELGTAVHEEVRDLVSTGVSPVRGFGRFAPYKNTEKYPGKRKPGRPVNLELTGEMLDALRFRRKGENSLEYGWLPGTDPDVLIRARAHQEGHSDGDFPARPVLPQDGEQFAVSVERRVKDVYSRRLQAMLKKSNR